MKLNWLGFSGFWVVREAVVGESGVAGEAKERERLVGPRSWVVEAVVVLGS